MLTGLRIFDCDPSLHEDRELIEVASKSKFTNISAFYNYDIWWSICLCLFRLIWINCIIGLCKCFFDYNVTHDGWYYLHFTRWTFISKLKIIERIWNGSWNIIVHCKQCMRKYFLEIFLSNYFKNRCWNRIWRIYYRLFPFYANQ